MVINSDGSGNAYIESTMPNNEAVRVSFIEEGWTGDPCIRINLRDTNNHVRPGAEFPIDNIDEIIAAMQKLSQELKEKIQF